MHPLNKKVKFMKDSIDFGSMEIPKLFRKLLIPTVLGMVFSAVFVITDGIFVGQGIGSDALAAVNITAPLFLISTGIGLMFGVGASVVASIHLSQGKLKTARINVTQAVVISSLFLAVLWGVVCLFAPQVAVWLGSSERLLPLAVEYMYWFLPFLVFSALLSSGMFFVRLDGSPNYAMLCNAIPAVVNILLDYVFIFILKWGMMGAALATSLGYILGAGMIVVYLSRRRNVIHFCRVKLSKKSMRLTWRNVKYMCHLGVSTFLCEAAIACMMFAGNYVFIHYLGEDGVAAFSIACYFFPIIFMVYNAIGQSAQPILSYNFGAGDAMRVRSAFRLALGTAVTCGLVFFALTALFNHQIVAMFIDRSYPAYDIAVAGLPLFASGFIFFAVNIVSIGYFQSVERARPAMMITVLRGFVFMVYNAIGQSAQPILSYNFGAGDTMRVRSAFRLALGTAVTCGLVFFALTALFNHQIVAMFIDRSYPAYDIAVAGLPLFASGFIFFAVNIVSIGYFQSVERARPAMIVTVLRGFVFMVLCLLGLPLLLKVPGIWLAVPLAEILTFLVIMVIYYRKHQWVRR